MSNMNHMKHLAEVAESDIAVLRRKEATYQGSWKKEGGQSAWFMFKRNMDRLGVMLARPEPPVGFNMTNLNDTIDAVSSGKVVVGLDGAGISSVSDARTAVKFPGVLPVTVQMLEYVRDCLTANDIFAKIEEKPNGEDGSALACLRDLRRYATLVEAEMIARGVCKPEERLLTEITEREPDNLDQIMDHVGVLLESVTSGKFSGMGYEKEKFAIRQLAALTGVDQYDQMDGTVNRGCGGGGGCIISAGGVGGSAPEVTYTNTPRAGESAEQTAARTARGYDSTYPWVCDVSKMSKVTRDILYEQRAPGVWKLEMMITEADKFTLEISTSDMDDIRAALSRYVPGPVHKTWILDITRMPLDIRVTMYPILRREYNATELEVLTLWQRGMYEWVTAGTGYRIKPQYEGWTKAEVSA